MKRILIKTVIILILTVVIFIAGFFIFLMLTEFRPPAWSNLPVDGRGVAPEKDQREFTLMTWNIGYAGLGAGANFFYDGGKMVRAGKSETVQNLKRISELILDNDTLDFILIQEIDRLSKRTWNVDEYDEIAARLPGFSGVFAPNYDCRFIPVPVTEPIGEVLSGLANFSRAQPASASVRYFDAYFGWPKRLVFLKRCFVMIRHPLDNGRELVVINTHNSAFDSSGALRNRELFILDSVMRKEYSKGNYVIAGGDWNSNPGGFNPSRIKTGDNVTTIDPPIGDHIFPGWTFAFDTLRPSNRFVDTGYIKGKTRVTTIDFFVLSPNIKLEKINSCSTGFLSSDHEPVILKVRLL